MTTVIGEISETLGEVEVKWVISNFISLPEKTNESYDSPTFFFMAASWYIQIYPNGENAHMSNGFIGLYLIRGDSGPAVSVQYGFKIQANNHLKESSNTAVFKKKGHGWGSSEFISRSDLLEGDSNVGSSDCLIITCSLKHKETKNLKSSLCQRLKNVSDTLKDIYLTSKRYDVQLNVKDQRIPAHRIILESRSPVFAAMFTHDMKENRTGEVEIDDIDVKTFGYVLHFIYTGQIDWLTTENAPDIYAAAEKYDIKDLKQLCVEFMHYNMSVETLCDTIKLADLYHEEELVQSARKYFKDNALKVLETNNWKKFAKENHEISIELLEWAFKESAIK